jgi:hypothetical protein
MVHRFFENDRASRNCLQITLVLASVLGLTAGAFDNPIPFADATFTYHNRFELKLPSGLSSEASDSLSRVFSEEAENYIPDAAVLPGKLAGFVPASEFSKNNADAKFLLETPTLELKVSNRTDFDTSAILSKQTARVFYHHQYMHREGSTKFGAFRDQCKALANSEREVQATIQPSLILKAPRVLVRRVDNQLIRGNLSSSVSIAFGKSAKAAVRVIVTNPYASITTSPVSEDYSDFTYTCSASLVPVDSAGTLAAPTLRWDEAEVSELVQVLKDGQYLSKLLNTAFNGVSVEKASERSLTLKCLCQAGRLQLVAPELAGASTAQVTVAGLLSFETYETEEACLKKAKEIPLCL